MNPFTKEKVTLQTWEPVEPPTPLGKPCLHDDAWGPPVPPIVPVENDYMEGVERGGPPGLLALPHVRAKNFDPFVPFDALVAALAGDDVPVPPARLGSDDDVDVPVVDALPEAALRRLAALDDADLVGVMAAVLDAASPYDASDETRAYFVDRGLRPLRALAVEALRRGGTVCHHLALAY